MHLDGYSFDIGPMGAIGEQGSLLLRINRSCPWNRCLFCSTYKGRKFEYRTVEEIKRDIGIIRLLASKVNATSRELGQDGQVNEEVIQAVIQNDPDILPPSLTDNKLFGLRYASLVNVSHWLDAGGKNVFLQDADALIMRTPELVEVLDCLKKTFPTIERITCYARSKTCTHKSLEELKELHEAGLSRVLVGIESGYDPVLQFMQKGVTAREHIEGGKKIIKSGMGFVAFVMPGLGSRRWAEGHVLETIRVLNEIKPDIVRIRSLAIQEDSPLYDCWQSDKFESPSDDQMVGEIKQLVEGLNFNCDIETGQLTNILFEINGHLPEDKASILDIIRGYETMTAAERLRFRFRRYLRNYLPYIRSKDKLAGELPELLDKATEYLETCPPEAEQTIEKAILTIKQKGVP